MKTNEYEEKEGHLVQPGCVGIGDRATTDELHGEKRRRVDIPIEGPTHPKDAMMIRSLARPPTQGLERHHCAASAVARFLSRYCTRWFWWVVTRNR